MSASPKQTPPAPAGRKHLWVVAPAIVLVAGLLVFGHYFSKAVGIFEADAASTVVVAGTTTTPGAPPPAPPPADAKPADTKPADVKSATAPASADVKSSFSADQKKEIEKIIKDYLVANPDVMVEVQ